MKIEYTDGKVSRIFFSREENEKIIQEVNKFIGLINSSQFMNSNVFYMFRFVSNVNKSVFEYFARRISKESILPYNLSIAAYKSYLGSLLDDYNPDNMVLEKIEKEMNNDKDDNEKG